MARFFIDRPVFAIVIAIVIVILGGVAIPNLPIASFPEVVPPVVQITASYLGSNALDLEKTVAQPIEEQLAGLDGMLGRREVGRFVARKLHGTSGQVDELVAFHQRSSTVGRTLLDGNFINLAITRSNHRGLKIADRRVPPVTPRGVPRRIRRACPHS